MDHSSRSPIWPITIEPQATSVPPANVVLVLSLWLTYSSCQQVLLASKKQQLDVRSQSGMCLLSNLSPHFCAVCRTGCLFNTTILEYYF